MFHIDPAEVFVQAIALPRNLDSCFVLYYFCFEMSLVFVVAISFLHRHDQNFIENLFKYKMRVSQVLV